MHRRLSPTPSLPVQVPEPPSADPRASAVGAPVCMSPGRPGPGPASYARRAAHPPPRAVPLSPGAGTGLRVPTAPTRTPPHAVPLTPGAVTGLRVLAMPAQPPSHHPSDPGRSDRPLCACHARTHPPSGRPSDPGRRDRPRTGARAASSVFLRVPQFLRDPTTHFLEEKNTTAVPVARATWHRPSLLPEPREGSARPAPSPGHSVIGHSPAFAPAGPGSRWRFTSGAGAGGPAGPLQHRPSGRGRSFPRALTLWGGRGGFVRALSTHTRVRGMGFPQGPPRACAR